MGEMINVPDKGITVAELLKECQKMVNAGYGDKYIQISRDDEGNSFHSLFYGFTSNKKALQQFLDEDMFDNHNIDTVDDIVVLG